MRIFFIIALLIPVISFAQINELDLQVIDVIKNIPINGYNLRLSKGEQASNTYYYQFDNHQLIKPLRNLDDTLFILN